MPSPKSRKKNLSRRRSLDAWVESGGSHSDSDYQDDNNHDEESIHWDNDDQEIVSGTIVSKKSRAVKSTISTPTSKALDNLTNDLVGLALTDDLSPTSRPWVPKSVSAPVFAVIHEDSPNSGVKSAPKVILTTLTDPIMQTTPSPKGHTKKSSPSNPRGAHKSSSRPSATLQTPPHQILNLSDSPASIFSTPTSSSSSLPSPQTLLKDMSKPLPPTPKHGKSKHKHSSPYSTSPLASRSTSSLPMDSSPIVLSSSSSSSSRSTPKKQDSDARIHKRSTDKDSAIQNLVKSFTKLVTNPREKHPTPTHEQPTSDSLQYPSPYDDILHTRSNISVEQKTPGLHPPKNNHGAVSRVITPEPYQNFRSQPQVHDGVLVRPKTPPETPMALTHKAQITPATPSSPAASQCRGFNKKTGERCTRRVKREKNGEIGDGYCHQHKETARVEMLIFVSEGVRLRWIRIDEWIRPDISEATRRRLRQEMEKLVSNSDEPGFIYVYILDEGLTALHKNPNTLLYKIGRTTNLNRRMLQWSQKCGVTPRLLEYFPIPSTPDAISPQRIKLSHRVERLIHLELSERHRAEVAICEGCGEVHREWFRVEKKSSKDSEIDGWSQLRPVVAHWVQYIELFYGVS